MHEQATEVLGVLLHPVVFRPDLLLLEEPEHVLLELSGTLTRDDLHQRRLLGLRLVDDGPQRAVDVLPAVVDVVQVKLQLHAHPPAPGPQGLMDTVARRSPRPSGRACRPGPPGSPVRPARAARAPGAGWRAAARGRSDRLGRPAAG